MKKVLIALVMTVLSASCFAQTSSLEKIQEAFVSKWRVTITPGILVFDVSSIEQKSENIFNLSATFGFEGGNMNPVESQVEKIDNGYKLEFKTKSGRHYKLTQVDDGVFKGTYSNPSGETHPVLSFVKHGQDMVAKKPEANIPKECAAYLGAWKGEWKKGGIGTVYLFVPKINDACVADYRYGSEAGTVEIKDGEMGEFLCNPGTKGVCKFKHSSSDDSLSASYSNPGGGTNWATFIRVKK
ncbi:hypothetical protein K9M47_03415 [Candidatus Gracilibacteria bacterium]|nr:hypothetical protein [Candidatus Gracilibacteria bacterium]MCF7898978.1 hypothetical protein [Candidatus Paceibacterota bacterium]